MKVIEGPNGPCPLKKGIPNHDFDNTEYALGGEYDMICRKCGRMLIFDFVPNMITKDWREDDKN